MRVVSCFLKFGPGRDLLDTAFSEQRRPQPASTRTTPPTPKLLYQCLVQVATGLQDKDLSVWSKNCNHGGVARTPVGGHVTFLQALGVLKKVGSVGSSKLTTVTLGEQRGQYQIVPLDAALSGRLQTLIDACSPLHMITSRLFLAGPTCQAMMLTMMLCSTLHGHVCVLARVYTMLDWESSIQQLATVLVNAGIVSQTDGYTATWFARSWLVCGP